MSIDIQITEPHVVLPAAIVNEAIDMLRNIPHTSTSLRARLEALMADPQREIAPVQLNALIEYPTEIHVPAGCDVCCGEIIRWTPGHGTGYCIECDSEIQLPPAASDTDRYRSFWAEHRLVQDHATVDGQLIA